MRLLILLISILSFLNLSNNTNIKTFFIFTPIVVIKILITCKILYSFLGTELCRIYSLGAHHTPIFLPILINWPDETVDFLKCSPQRSWSKSDLFIQE